MMEFRGSLDPDLLHCAGRRSSSCPFPKTVDGVRQQLVAGPRWHERRQGKRTTASSPSSGRSKQRRGLRSATDDDWLDAEDLIIEMVDETDPPLPR